MHSCLIKICQEFETLEGFMKNQTTQKKELVDTLFLQFMNCFKELKEEKLEYPKEFQGDVKLFHEGFAPLLQKFEDEEIRYLMLSDFYDYVRLTKRYKKVKN
jgi:hypothetical protein